MVLYALLLGLIHREPHWIRKRKAKLKANRALRAARNEVLAKQSDVETTKRILQDLECDRQATGVFSAATQADTDDDESRWVRSRELIRSSLFNVTIPQRKTLM